MRKISVATVGLAAAFVGVVLLVNTAGAGEYQRTRDAKTLVWNATPKSGDEATWFGDRDGEGYATGVGTLTWYNGNGTVFGRYFGNMVRGKFNGAVNLHLKGRTAHAVFEDGERVSRWSTGPAPSRSEVPARAVAAKKKIEATPVPKPESTVVAKRESPSPATTPAEQTATPPRAEKISRAQPVTDAEPSPSVETTTTAVAQAKRPASDGAVPEKTKKPSRQKSKSSFDPSLTALVGPPSSLRNIPTNNHLSEQEVIELANGEARAQGYNLEDFQRPKADYSAVTDKWTLFYEQRSPDGSTQAGKYFTATVEDKTRRVVVSNR